MSIDEPMTPARSDRIALLSKLMATPWSDLAAVEHCGRLHFPEKVVRRKANGETEEIDVTICLPRPDELRWARVNARKAALEAGLDLDRDQDLVDDMENVHILARAIRNTSEPFEPWVPNPAELERDYDKRSLSQMWAKMNALVNIVDPRQTEMSKEELLAVIAAIAKTREIYPLHALGQHSQSHCIVTMAELCVTFLASTSSSEPSDSSMQEP